MVSKIEQVRRRQSLQIGWSSFNTCENRQISSMLDLMSDSKTWLAESVRFTGFFVPPLKVDVTATFEAVFGRKPDSQTTKIKDLMSSAEAETENRVLKLEIKPDRIDVRIDPKVTEDFFATGRFPSLGEVPPTIAQIIDKASALIAVTGPFTRYAVGTTCWIPAADINAPYDFMRETLKIPYLNKRDFSDFSFRINRPFKAKFDGTEVGINRLSTWVAVTMRMGIGGDPIAPNQIVKSLSHATRVEFDVNTDAALQLLSEGVKIPPHAIIKELARLTLEMVSQGVL